MGEFDMDTRHLVDREIAPLIDLFPRVDLESAPIAQIRAKAAETYSILPPPVITPERLVVPSIHGGPDIPVFLFHPADARAGGGAILHIHGGGWQDRGLLCAGRFLFQGPDARTGRCAGRRCPGSARV